MFNKSEKGQIGTYVALGLVVIGMLVGLWYVMASLHRTDPGYVGVIIHYQTGSVGGLGTVELAPTGRYVWIHPIFDRFEEYPVAQQTLTMVAEEREGQVVGDDSVKCQDKNGVPLFIDSSTLWRVDPEKAGLLYQLRPGMPLIGHEGGDISSVLVRREVRFAVTTACSYYAYDEIFGSQRLAYSAKVEELLGPALSRSYIIMDSFFASEIHLSKEQVDAINLKVLAQQAAETAFFLIQQRENEAKARIAEAEGEAEAIRIFNEQLAASPFYIQYLYALAWDGQLPTVLFTGGGTDSFPMIALPDALVDPNGQQTQDANGTGTGH